MKPFAIILFGSPGSGKSTQADLLAQKYGLVHFDTGKYIERIISDPKRQKEPIVKKIKKQWSTGEMSDTSFVLHIIQEYVHKFALQQDSIVFSGSPRTIHEVQGNASHRGFIDILEKEYGKKRVFYFELSVSEKDAKKRNTKRLMCSACGTPLLGAALNLKIKSCPFCGGKLYKRKLDNADVIEKRFKVYTEETMPIFSIVQKAGYKIQKISATPLPYKIFNDLVSRIDALIKI